jgi:curved DNA-binding protein
MTSKDPYAILGVERQASAEEIKRAYRRLAKEYHPDRNPGNKSAEQRFKEVHAAYEVLGDRQRRAQYDRFGAGGPAPQFYAWTADAGAPYEGARFDFDSLGDLTSIFEQFFARAEPRGRQRRGSRTARPRGADVSAVVELSFEEALHGTARELVLAESGQGGQTERIEVRIPPGVHDGQRIRVQGKGQAGPGGPGNLMILCRIRTHPIVRLEGRDVLLDLPLTFTEAALGASVEIPTPDGPTVVKVPPGTSSGTKLRLRGRGMPEGRGGARGDLFAIVRIVAPKQVSPPARRLLEELERELAQKPRTPWPT